MNPMGIYHQAKDHASKLAENVGRVAALLHFFEGYDGDISLSTFNAAQRICDNCSKCFVQTFNAPLQEEEDANKLISRLDNINEPVFFYGRYIAKNFVRQRVLRNTERLNKAINILVKRGTIVIVSDGKTKYIDVKPDLRQIDGLNLASL